MPELPEVETICRALRKNIKSKEISKFKIFNQNLRWKVDGNISKFLNNNTLISIKRKGKYLLFHFPNGTLIIHLGMTGVLKFLAAKESLATQNHDHYQIIFKDKSKLLYNDVRKFGSIHWESKAENNFLIKNLGVEPLSKDFNEDYLFKIGKKRKLSIKNLIMDQKVVTGIGNIYACESLFSSKIHPHKKSNKLTRRNYTDLVSSIKKVLNSAIKSGGTSIRNFRKIDGELGYFSQKLSVYGKINCPCKLNVKIKKIKTNGRTSFFCGNCQKY